MKMYVVSSGINSREVIIEGDMIYDRDEAGAIVFPGEVCRAFPRSEFEREKGHCSEEDLNKKCKTITVYKSKEDAKKAARNFASLAEADARLEAHAEILGQIMGLPYKPKNIQKDIFAIFTVSVDPGLVSGAEKEIGEDGVARYKMDPANLKLVDAELNEKYYRYVDFLDLETRAYQNKWDNFVPDEKVPVQDDKSQLQSENINTLGAGLQELIFSQASPAARKARSEAKTKQLEAEWNAFLLDEKQIVRHHSIKNWIQQKEDVGHLTPEVAKQRFNRMFDLYNQSWWRAYRSQAKTLKANVNKATSMSSIHGLFSEAQAKQKTAPVESSYTRMLNVAVDNTAVPAAYDCLKEKVSHDPMNVVIEYLDFSSIPLPKMK